MNLKEWVQEQRRLLEEAGILPKEREANVEQGMQLR